MKFNAVKLNIVKLNILKQKYKKTSKVLLRLGIVSLVIALSWGIAAGSIAVSGLMMQQHTNADVAVVFGSKIHSTGRISKGLKSRLETAYYLYQQGFCKLIVVSGGIDPSGNYEGSIMKAYLVKRGVPEAQIIADDYGNNTRATALNLKEIIKDSDNQVLKELRNKNAEVKCAIVSQFFHLPRIKVTFEQEGLQVCSSAYPKAFFKRDIYSTIREAIGYLAYSMQMR